MGWPTPWSLTSRELQVAQLAAQDLGNRRIADRLGVSTRMVETHRHRAYAHGGLVGTIIYFKRLHGRLMCRRP